LVFAPLASACTLGWSSRTTRILACSISDARDAGAVEERLDSDFNLVGFRNVSAAGPAIDAGAIALSAEPPQRRPAAEPVAPVIFSGYVLPDDCLEDRSHEGS
jgi:hypothetical protein